MTPEERKAFDAGVAFGRIRERMEHKCSDFVRPMGVREAARPNLHIVPTDEPTARILNFPINEKTAS